MARVIVPTSFCDSYTQGQNALEIDAANVMQLVGELDRRFPGFGAFIEQRVSVVVDSVMTQNWTSALKPGSEVVLVPRIAGG